MNLLFSRLARPGPLALCGLWLLLASATAGTQPVTVKELSLMLRGGYTGADVLHETAGRPLLEPLDAAAEKSLRQAGADTAFIDTLRTTRHALTADEAAAARQRQETVDQRTAATRQAEPPRVPSPPAAAPAVPAPAPTADRYLETLLEGKLATFDDGRFKPQNGSILGNKKIIALYYSTYVSAGGRRFAPELVKFYRGFRPAHPEFELVVISGDRSVFDLENMMRREKMPWPALIFDQLGTAPMKPLMSFMDRSGSSRLILADSGGHMLADYAITFTENNDALVLADVPKVVADPTKASTFAPPHPAAAPAASTPR